jgi:short-subunit dehydrogenase
MRSQRRGHIVNVSSVAGRIAPPYMGIYSATKFALTAVSDALRNELASSGVSVTTVFPGLTETSFQDHMLREVDMPSIPPVARFVTASAAAVGRRIAEAVRWNLRDVYVSPGDVAAVGLNTVAPHLVDWATQLFWLPLVGSGRVTPPPQRGAPEPLAVDAEPPPDSA